ncbi:MAG: cation:proton antiporter, partial [Candidatus Sedimenticola endophacoides]
MVEGLLYLTAALGATAFLLALGRFIRGPSAADRVAAFDVLTIISITG